MDREEMGALIRRQPFQPFDIEVSDGRVYAVDHPEFVARSRDGRTIYLSTEDERLVILAVDHIVTVEIANRPTAA